MPPAAGTREACRSVIATSRARDVVNPSRVQLLQFAAPGCGMQNRSAGDEEAVVNFSISLRRNANQLAGSTAFIGMCARASAVSRNVPWCRV